MIDLVLSAEQVQTIEREGSAAYPNECCGIMYGRDVGNERRVERLETVANAFEAGKQYHRFSITPQNLMAAEKSAARERLLVLGFYHSHPDHPARPSEYDRQHGWPFYSYVIVAIAKRQPGAMTSWVLNEVTEQFEEQRIVRA